jgi:heme-degrading monooxygenase HmoA
MFSVIFEVNRKPEKEDEYLENAKHLKPVLEKIEGFIDNERFQSKLRDGWLLSHSTWTDEKAVVRWRTNAEHHRVQERGRFEIFRDYHLRVGDVIRDTAPPPEAPVRETRFDETQVGKGKYVSLTEIEPIEGMSASITPDSLTEHLGLNQEDGLIDLDAWESIYSPGKQAVTATWRDKAVATRWCPRRFSAVKILRHRVVLIVRDYGMFDRREAPQFYPEVSAVSAP